MYLKSTLFRGFFSLCILFAGYGLFPAQMPPFAWAVSTGGPLGDEGNVVIIDAQGNAYCAGFHQQTADLDPGTAVLSGPGPGIHIQKLDAAGNLIWAVNYASTGFFYCYDLAFDPAGNLVAVGTFTGTVDFDPGAGVSNLTASGSQDVFLLKLTPAGGLVFVTRAVSGGGQNEIPKGMVLDSQGNIVLAGNFDGTVDCDPGAGTTILNSTGSNDAFVAKYDANGNLLWAHGFGNTASDGVLDLTVDSAGNLTAAGRFGATVDFDPGGGTFPLTSAGTFDGFILRLSPAGNFVWAKALTTTVTNDNCAPNAIVTDTAGNLVVGGTFFGTVDLDPSAGQAITPTHGLSDMFVLKLDSAGNYMWSFHFGGNFQDGLQTAAVDSQSNIYVAGTYEGTVDLDPGPGQFSATAVNYKDFAVCQFSPSGNFNWAAIISGTNNDFVNHIRISPQGDLFVTGAYYLTTDFDPGAGVFNLTSTSGADAFVFKLGNCSSAINPTIQVNGNVLTATPSGATYQWLDCDNGFLPVSGATQQTWSPTVSGSYAVAVTVDGCVDTSACEAVQIVGLMDAAGVEIVLSPNPAQDFVRLSADIVLEDVVVTNVLGKVMGRWAVGAGMTVVVDVRGWADGVYFVRAGTVVRKLVVDN
jgi:hypothetical protein